MTTFEIMNPSGFMTTLEMKGSDTINTRKAKIQKLKGLRWASRNPRSWYAGPGLTVSGRGLRRVVPLWTKQVARESLGSSTLRITAIPDVSPALNEAMRKFNQIAVRSQPTPQTIVQNMMQHMTVASLGELLESTATSNNMRVRFRLSSPTMSCVRWRN